ncbi:uncharacterized protein F5891DRAFT_1188376 [Suillus fuscotomentosus]|uniref:Uncharacterized protein n=1 Tax=Suillus fuscotomentosus TaxID=1912939 RepID=A0AAD4E790_9AGAM|nr:uncharacterized protein F5891DRAFT_1188376 [Suillus fuscotomentosus]KAG1900875.1 hypothetical protein F5891DRAFT_1188376 [Suillus fuscotomentosus]
MAPSRSALDRERHLSKHYNLRSSHFKLKPFLLSSRPFSCTDNDNELLRVEVKITHEAVSKIGTLLSADVIQLRKEVAKAKREIKKASAERDNVTAAHQSTNSYCAVLANYRRRVTMFDLPGGYRTAFHPGMARLSDCANERLPKRFQDHLAPFTTAEVKELCDGPGAIIPGRFYICPTCPAYVGKPPVEIPLLRVKWSTLLLERMVLT